MQKLFAISVAGALAFGANTAVAQDKVDGQAVQAIQKENSVPPNTGDSKSEQGGKTEPSSKIPHTNPEPHAFVNGVLSAPGAMTDVDTAPAKFSARTDADDKMPIAGYRLKHLTGEQLQRHPSSSGSKPRASAEEGAGRRLVQLARSASSRQDAVRMHLGARLGERRFQLRGRSENVPEVWLSPFRQRHALGSSSHDGSKTLIYSAILTLGGTDWHTVPLLVSDAGKDQLAERGGFEPPRPVTQSAAFRVRCIQPLCHLSKRRSRKQARL